MSAVTAEVMPLPPRSSTTPSASAAGTRRLVQTKLALLSPVSEAPGSSSSATRPPPQCSPVKFARLDNTAADAAATRKASATSATRTRLRRSRSCDPTAATAAAAGSSSASSTAGSVTGQKKSPSLEDFFPAAVARRSERRLCKAAARDFAAEAVTRILAGCQDGLKVVQLPDKGRGVVATRPFSRDEFVVEYKGDLVDYKAAKLREQAYNSDPSVGCYMYYFIARGAKLCIDATAESAFYGRLLNHSRLNPNCYTRVVPVGDSPRLCLFAKRDVCVGEELLYDYGDRDPATLAAHPWLKS